MPAFDMALGAASGGDDEAAGAPDNGMVWCAFLEAPPAWDANAPLRAAARSRWQEAERVAWGTDWGL